jgi:hypothetical protein
MTVSAGVGGGTLGGVVVGGAFTGGGGSISLPSTLPAALPFTGASHVVLFFAAALILIVAGILLAGLARRVPDYLDGSAPAPS